METAAGKVGATSPAELVVEASVQSDVEKATGACVAKLPTEFGNKYDRPFTDSSLCARHAHFDRA